MPSNASLDYLGSGWTCNRGYARKGDVCEKVVIPQNASLDFIGSSWTCNRGFFRKGSECERVAIPANATLDYTGASWTCIKGFSRKGDRCEKLEIPANASLDFSGNGWICNKGYRRSGSECAVMTDEEKRRQLALESEVRKRIAERKARGVSGEHCESEYKTNAQVCVETGRTTLDCNKSVFGEQYSDCDVDVSYEVKTDYSGRSSLSAEVECKVEIEYSGRTMIGTSNDSSRKSDTHSLSAHDSSSERFRFNFSFSSLSEVTRVRIARVRCEVESVDLD